jgi:hyperosmotically inducible periplasmic protein
MIERSYSYSARLPTNAGLQPPQHCQGRELSPDAFVVESGERKGTLMKTVKKGLLAASSIAVLLALGACGERETAMEQRADTATSEARQEAREETSQAGSTIMGAGQQTATAIDDAQIVTKVKSKLAADDEIKALSIDVDSKDGMVTLTGTVPSDAAKDRAADIVKNTEDVKGVDNQLNVQS